MSRDAHTVDMKLRFAHRYSEQLPGRTQRLNARTAAALRCSGSSSELRRSQWERVIHAQLARRLTTRSPEHREQSVHSRLRILFRSGLTLTCYDTLSFKCFSGSIFTAWVCFSFLFAPPLLSLTEDSQVQGLQLCLSFCVC